MVKMLIAGRYSQGDSYFGIRWNYRCLWTNPLIEKLPSVRRIAEAVSFSVSNGRSTSRAICSEQTTSTLLSGRFNGLLDGKRRKKRVGVH